MGGKRQGVGMEGEQPALWVPLTAALGEGSPAFGEAPGTDRGEGIHRPHRVWDTGGRGAFELLPKRTPESKPEEGRPGEKGARLATGALRTVLGLHCSHRGGHRGPSKRPPCLQLGHQYSLGGQRKAFCTTGVSSFGEGEGRTQGPVSSL